jgi:hypothetical protein
MDELRKYHSHNDHISLASLIDFYEDLLKDGKIKAGSAGEGRLQQLYQKRYHYRKWVTMPYAKRRHIISPLKT